MAFTLDNFVRSTLQADITAGATTVTVTKAAPPLRDPPDATPTAPGLLVLQDAPASPTKIEVISYTGRSIVGTVVTLTGVTRGLEGSTASPWSAGTPTFQGITAAVVAQKLDASGTAAKATQLETPRTIALGGLLGGSASFDGSGNVTITATMGAGLQTELDGREPFIAAGTAAQYRRGDKTWQTLDKAAVGLGNVDNTSDASKPVSTPQQSALDAKASLSGAAFTGNVSAAGQVSALGPTSSVNFPDRGDAAQVWQLYASGGFARLYNPMVGTDVVSVSASGNMSVLGSLVLGGGRKVSKVTLGTAIPPTLADGELYLQF